MALNNWKKNTSGDYGLLLLFLLLWVISFLIWIALSLGLSLGLLYGVKYVTSTYGYFNVDYFEVGIVDILLGGIFFALVLKDFIGGDSRNNINDMKDALTDEINSLHRTVEELKIDQNESLRQIESYLSSIDSNIDRN